MFSIIIPSLKIFLRAAWISNIFLDKVLLLEFILLFNPSVVSLKDLVVAYFDKSIVKILFSNFKGEYTENFSAFY